jgi:hypothetical protein
VRTIGANERDDTRRCCRKLACRVDQRARAVVRTAGGEDGGDAVGAKEAQYFCHRKRRGSLVVLVQVGVEEFLRCLRARRRAERQKPRGNP